MNNARLKAVSNDPNRVEITRLTDILTVNDTSEGAWFDSLPFSGRDATCGVENEFQAVVIGERKNLDLAITIEESNYYKNLIRRTAAGDTSRKKIQGLEAYLEDKKDGIWENSWVRFPKKTLNQFAHNIFKADLKADKTDPQSTSRLDSQRFTRIVGDEAFVRIPVSYMLKLALADVVGEGSSLHPYIRISGEKMMTHYSNDNTSPEIFSFYPVRRVSSQSAGTEIARETLVRFLLTQLLSTYAEEQFKLKQHGQEVRVFFSASPPLMQKQLNDCISDTFYRYLFMSPCLSGWNRGEDKYRYMKLCHKVLSRSQINSIAKLKEAGIINSNLVVLPNSSNISLANNGTHISIGSKKLGRMLKDQASGFTPVHEKHIGDLVIKISEHFLSLFPGTYSASPYRMNFEDFHPEKALGFLPHEIDYTHLRMIWRRWKKKAKIRILGKPITPFGPLWFDRLLSKTFRLKGDFVPDFRLVDYFVSLMSTHQSPSLNGVLGNSDQLKNDLAHMGIFDERMPLYQLIRNRTYGEMGYTGYEHRYFSIFHTIMTDMAQAADLQNLITALAYHYILAGRVSHDMIPDTPDVESERRQIFFCSAINLPTFYVKTRTRNQFLKSILSTVKKTRQSRRYSGYTRIRLADYKLALIEGLRKDTQGLVQSLNLQTLLSDLEYRIKTPKTHSTAGKLVSGILAGEKKKTPIQVAGEQFNKRAETFYIETLRKRQMAEGFAVLEKEFRQMELWAQFRDPSLKSALSTVLDKTDLTRFIDQVKKPFLKNRLSHKEIKKLIFLIILYVKQKEKTYTR